ncbi:MAG: hypothetical protein ACAH83_07105 [Alphaproteobacteria bacterium]
MSELQSPNWNEAKIDPQDLANKVENKLSDLAKQCNTMGHSKFMANMNKSGDTFGLGGMMGNTQQPQTRTAANSQFLMGNAGMTKYEIVTAQKDSGRNAMGMDMSYFEKKAWARAKKGGRVSSKSNDVFGNTEKEISSRARIASQSLGAGGYVSPQGIKANPQMAAQLGGSELFNTMLDARREDATPSEYRALNGAADGNDKLKDAAKQVSDDVKVEFVKKLDDPKPLANLLLNEEVAEKARQPIDAPKPKHLQPPAPPAPNGLMGEA